MRKAMGCCILFLSVAIHAQTLMNRDSLLKLLPTAKADTNTVFLYINIGQQYESNEPEKAKFYYRSARDLSQKINYPRGVIKYIVNYTFVLNMQGLYDSSLILNLQSVALSRQIKDSVYLAKTLFNTGSVYRGKGEYENAVACYEEGKKIFTKFGDPDIESRTDDILQLLYFDMKQYGRSIDFGKNAIAGLRKIDDPSSLGMALNNLGLTYSYLRHFDTAAILFQQALDIAHQVSDKNMEVNQYLNLGNVFLQQGLYDKMKPYMERALVLAKELESYEIELMSKEGLASYYTSKKNYALAEQYAKEALALSYRYDLKLERVKVFSQLSNLSFAKQDIQLGNLYAAKSTQLADSLLNKSIQENTMELEKKYETAKKENQIHQLESDKKVQQFSIRQKNILNYILIAGAATLLLISLLGYRNYRQKQKLQEQRISELEKEKQLTATEAVLKGEEQERTRLAKDLHDGLGGMMSGIKYSLLTMKRNLVMTPENQQAFERSMDMLDHSIQEMRRVAHNMMPEALLKFGLDTALKDLCNDINQTGALRVNYQSIGMEKMIIDQTTSIAIYRIVQELINNTMKHAGAQSAIVQLTKTNNTLSITVEDDGKGFDTSILNATTGMGWSNIQSRIEYLKGKIDTRSDAGKGTSVHIELNIS
jgi:signal transduction histidine kinase